MRMWLCAVAATIVTFAMPIAALADEDENVPLTPQQKSAQLSTLAVIAVVILVAVGYYYFRRWQTLKSGARIDGNYKDD